MKLLPDQNLSWKLVAQLIDLFPGTEHIKSVLTVETDDRDIWDYAKEHGLAIVSKDDDFLQRSILFGHPPKIICIRLGNCVSNDVLELLSNSTRVIGEFASDKEKSYLILP